MTLSVTLSLSTKLNCGIALGLFCPSFYPFPGTLRPQLAWCLMGAEPGHAQQGILGQNSDTSLSSMPALDPRASSLTKPCLGYQVV